MGCFGSDYCKPLELWSSSINVMWFSRKKPTQTKKLAVTKNGSVTGTRKALKESAAYTHGFGMCFADILKDHLKQAAINAD